MKNYILLAFLVSFGSTNKSNYQENEGVIRYLCDNEEKQNILKKISDRSIPLEMILFEGYSCTFEEFDTLKNFTHGIAILENNVSIIPKFVYNQKDLKILRMDNTSIFELDSNIGSLKHLEILDMRQNEISLVSNKIADLKSLRKLILYRNKLKAIPKAFSLLPNLQILSLGENMLSNVRDFKSGSIKELYLPNNLITEIDIELFECSSLITLDLSFNKLKLIPNEISRLKNIKTLNLSNNEITSLPLGLSKLKNLEELNINGNFIAKENIDEIQSLLPNCKIIR